MPEKIRVAILGASGYTARELLLLLLRHPHVEIAAVTTRQEGREGAPLVSELHPSLYGRLAIRCEPLDAEELARRGVRCVFACLPHGREHGNRASTVAAGIASH
jgi:N-acetyl-gamma-glutamyl-phosphate reductase